MVSKLEWDLYQLIPWPEYIKGRDLRQKYKEATGKSIRGAVIYPALMRLKDQGFIEVEEERELIDTPVTESSYRKSAGGKRPEPPKRSQPKRSLDIIPETS